MIYLSIKELNRGVKSDGFLKKSIAFMLGLFIPKANPDFDDKIDLVAIWLLEFEDDHSIPSREIGLDDEGQILVKMPDVRNCGYWVDNSLRYLDFIERFESTIIARGEFEKKWDSLIKQK
jgi:hypothetical protein